MPNYSPDRKHFRLWIGSILALAISLISLNRATAQPAAHVDDQKAVAPVEPETPEFKAATDELREHVKKMREILVRYNVSSSPEEDRRYKQDWFELRKAGVSIHQRMIDAAVAEYNARPSDKAEIADMLWGVLDRNVESDQYEGMLDVARALMQNGYQQEKLRGAFIMTAFALNEYDVAKPLLEELIREGMAEPQFLGLQEYLERVRELWKEELEARERDAQGEPLPRVLIRTTKGEMEVELFENQAPETVGNFIHLIESGFYEGLVFHRVLQHFMAQTGCPNGDGSGGPGYTIHGEMKKPEARNFFRGTLGMALSQHPDSGGSQFFISFIPTYHLNGDYTAFGRVTSGMDVLGNLVLVNPDEKKDESAAPEMPDEIVSIEVLYKRDHEYKPNRVQQ